MLVLGVALHDLQDARQLRASSDFCGEDGGTPMLPLPMRGVVQVMITPPAIQATQSRQSKHYDSQAGFTTVDAHATGPTKHTVRALLPRPLLLLAAACVGLCGLLLAYNLSSRPASPASALADHSGAGGAGGAKLAMW